MTRGDEQAMTRLTNTSFVLRALESTIQEQKRGDDFRMTAVLDDIRHTLFTDVATARSAQSDTRIAHIDSILACLADIHRKCLLSDDGKTSSAPNPPSPTHLSGEPAIALTTFRQSSSPFRPLHGRLPCDLYLPILRYVGDNVDNVDVRNCRGVDQFTRNLVDSDSRFWAPVALRGIASVLNAGFFIDRAGQAPVDVSLHLTTDQHHAVNGPLAQVAARMGRIGSLTVVSDRLIPGPLFAELLCVEAPFLFALSIDGCIGGDVPAVRRIGRHPKLHLLRANVSCLRALRSANLADLRYGVTHLEVTAAAEGKTTTGELFGLFPGLQSAILPASCLEDSFWRVGNVPPHLELIEEDASAGPQQSAGVISCLPMNALRRLIVRRANASTIDLVRAQYQVVHRLAIMPTQLAFWVRFERARIFPDAHPDVIADFVGSMRYRTLSSLIIARTVPTDVLRHVSKGDFRRLRVLTVYVGPTTCAREAADVLNGRRTWWCPRLRELRIVARMDDADAVATEKGVPTVKAAEVIRFVKDTLRYAPLRELRFEGVRLAEGMEGPQDANVRKLARSVRFE